MVFENCRIVPIKKHKISFTLFDEEIEEAEFVCLALNKSYVQFFIEKIREELKKLGGE